MSGDTITATGDAAQMIVDALTRTPTKPREALTSAASAEWGTPEVCRRFAACVLRPASRTDSAIDVDGSSSAYWHAQWSAEHRPAAYLDGSPGKSILVPEDWKALRDRLFGARQLQIGSVFENAPGIIPGLSLGEAVQACWYVLARMHKSMLIDSVVWQGFNLDQLRSLIPDAAELADKLMHPLHQEACSIFPNRRVSYMAHPEAMIEIIDKRLGKRDLTPAAAAALHKRRLELTNRADDSPVPGPAPTHASYITVLWSHENSVRKRQQRAAKDFINGQAQTPNSVLKRAVLIGRTD